MTGGFMKRFFLSMCLITAFFMGGCMSLLSKMPRNEGETDFYWIPEESGFVDYQIRNDKIIFSYSICFVNDSEEDIAVAVSAKFKESEIKDWIQCEIFILGCDEDGNMKYELIESKGKKNVVFYFEGKYISSNVNTNLSFPDELILTTR